MRSWCSATIWMVRLERPGVFKSKSTPSGAWVFMMVNSSSVSLPGLFRMLLGILILPMSWSRPPRPASCTVAWSIPMALLKDTMRAQMLTQCLKV